MRDLIYRADASPEIGFGHVVRGISLSQALDRNEVYLYTRKLPIELEKRVQNENMQIEEVIDDEDFFLKLKGLKRQVIVVLDGYNFDYPYQKRIKNIGHKVVVIDDWGGGEFCADAVINHNLGLNPADYKGVAELYTGPDYLLLRKSFLTKKNDVRSNIKEDTGTDVFICMGGSDPQNLTGKILELLQHDELNLHVVSNKRYRLNKDSITFYEDLGASEMASLLRYCNFGIIPASTLMHEAACCRLKILLGYYVENQKKAYKEFVNKDLGMPLGDLNELNREMLLDSIKHFDPAVLQNVRQVYKLDNSKLREVFINV